MPVLATNAFLTPYTQISHRHHTPFLPAYALLFSGPAFVVTGTLTGLGQVMCPKIPWLAGNSCMGGHGRTGSRAGWLRTWYEHDLRGMLKLSPKSGMRHDRTKQTLPVFSAQAHSVVLSGHGGAGARLTADLLTRLSLCPQAGGFSSF
jgi:hypothetical protein